ncbi:hypothetical protein LCGC14_0789740 [marine sediment metagenome]|uniref:DNA primase/polymerase bifunctional N-terminal domain-containing protein n=1 Tax=marine sediment metagenome TaxID=412755 RepID=A0A0F9T028_9ZZZZ
MVAKPKSSDAVFQTLAWVRKHGFKPVPIRPASKAAHIGGYTALDYEPPHDETWHRQEFGVGVVVGPAHSGPIDIDVDAKEALYFAARFLPKTPAIFGRKTKRRSHYIYRVDADAMTKVALVDPLLEGKDDGKTIIEIRADGGHQTVFPGSIHEGTGELIEWENNPLPDVPVIPAATLELAVRKVAAAVIITRHAWMEGQRNEAVKHLTGMLFYYEWEMSDALDFIDAICSFNEDKDRTRLITARSTFKKAEKTGKVTGGPSMSSLLGDDKLVAKLNEWFGSPWQSVIEDYNARFAVVNLSGKFRVAEMTMGDMNVKRYVFMTKGDFGDLNAVDTVPGEKGPVPKFRIWLAAPQRRQYSGICFSPGSDDCGTQLNLWTGWGVEAKKGKCKAWIELGRDVICGGDEELWTWLMWWLANIVQDPQKKPFTAPVIVGGQGVGKSLLFEYFGKLLGAGYTMVSDAEQVHGKFNNHLTHTLLLHSEEALFGGDRKHRSIIKSLITDHSRMVEPKGIDAHPVANHLRLILTSNEHWAAAVEHDDRRFTIIDMEKRMIEPKLLKAVLTELDGTGPAALLYQLQRVKYNHDVIRTNIKNAAHLEMKQENLEPIAEWWQETLQRGQLLDDNMRWAQGDKSAWPVRAGSSSLWHCMVEALKRRNARFIPTAATFANELNRLVGVRLHRKQLWFTNTNYDGDDVSERQSTITDMPSLADCRTSFEAYLGGVSFEWVEVNPDQPEHQKF